MLIKVYIILLAEESTHTFTWLVIGVKDIGNVYVGLGDSMNAYYAF